MIRMGAIFSIFGLTEETTTKTPTTKTPTTKPPTTKTPTTKTQTKITKCLVKGEDGVIYYVC